jgi:plasmid stabilization system protein ParE
LMRLTFTPLAEQDIETIADYIASAGVVITAPAGPRASLSKSRQCGPRPAHDRT